MKVTVIGTGNVGTALGGSLVRAGHSVTLAARDAEKTRRVAAQLGASAAADVQAGVQGADIVILAIPFGAIEAVAGDIGRTADGTVVVDVTNPLKPDYSGLATEGGPSAAEQLAVLLPGARIVKAFNTMFGSVQADPTALGTTLDALFATDDDIARTKVTALIGSLGFRPVDAGSLDAARQLEALAWLNMRIQMASGGDWRSSFVLVGAPLAAAKAA